MSEVELSRVPANRRVAVIDGIGEEATVDLYYEDHEGEVTEIEWPKDWPNWVSTEFLNSKGFSVITA